jgi:hypothetical protein
MTDVGLMPFSTRRAARTATRADGVSRFSRVEFSGMLGV